jgi:O-antigen/teichoic acid export membrane protein
MKRVLPHLLCIAGSILVLLGLVIRPAIRDGTAEMDLLSEAQSERLVMLLMAGILALVTGVLWVVVRWFRRRFNSNRPA